MRTRWQSLSVLCAIGLVGAAAAAWAQQDKAPPAKEAISIAAPLVLPAGAAPQAAPPPRFADAKDVTKDMLEMEGLFTLYRFNPEDRNRDPERLLAKIPKGLLNEDLLFATSISRGGPMTGFMWSDTLIRWEVVGNSLKLVTPDTRFVLKEGAPTTDVVKRTYNATYLTSAPILAMTPGGDVLIDLGALLKSNVADVGAMGGGAVRPDLSTWTKVKVFPDNLLIDVDLALQQAGGGRQVGVSYAFRRLPRLGSYQPRAADPRVGYFLTARQDWAKPSEERETFERYVNRWQLEKRDPTLELSPPKQPIVFIIEKTVPIPWRRWVRQGIEDWNKAYEKIGFVDAIVVQQQTEDNEYSDYDPEDARYNFFRWIVTGGGFAMGPSRADPRTGQILDADIVMDDSFVRYYMMDFGLYAPGNPVAQKGKAFADWAAANPGLVPLRMEQALQVRPTADEAIWEAAEQRLEHLGRCTCSYGRGMQEQMALLGNCLIATSTGRKIPERAIGEAIREVVTHEVGHTLGLRHNFKASAWLPLDEIKRRRNETDEPTTSSVMDYNPLLFFADDNPEKVRHFATPTIGPYDYWAIEYGYAVPPAGKAETDVLKEITGRCAQPELQYATDEDTMWVISPDPLSNRFDFSADPLAWARARVELCDKLLPDVVKWSVRDGEPRYYIRQAFNRLLSEKARNFGFVGRLVGGQYFYRDHNGDPNARPAFVLVEPALQRAALKYIAENLLTDAFFRIDPATLNQLPPSRWSHWGVDEASRLDYPIHDQITAQQTSVLFDLLNPPVLQRIYDAELKSADATKFTAAELLTTTRDRIWAQLDQPGNGPWTNANPYISSISRNLQREYVDMLLAAARTAPGASVSPDLHGMICFALRELSGKIGDKVKALPPANLDFATRAHLTECKSRIDRVLDAQFQAR